MKVRPLPATALALGTVAVAALVTLPIYQNSGAAPVVPPVEADIAKENSSCVIPPSASGGVSSDADTGTAAGFYDGPSASRTYDEKWKKAFPVPHLDYFVPQGMTTWTNWNGEGDTLLVIGLYRGTAAEGHQSVLAAVDPRTGRQYASVRVRNSHLGGIAVVGDFLFTQDRATRTRETVRRYKLSSLRTAFVESNKTGDMPFVGMLRDVETVYSADFMAVHDGRLWAGRYSEHEPDQMFEYSVDGNGALTPTGAGWPIPPRTQGVLVTDTTFVMNSSNHNEHGVMVVAEKSRSDSRRTVCFASPSMGENLTLVGDRAFNLFEGASFKYPNAVNRIADLHEASMKSLESLVHP